MSEEKKESTKSEEVREEKQEARELSKEEVSQVAGGADPLKIKYAKSDGADILQENDIISRAAKERCDVLFGLN